MKQSTGAGTVWLMLSVMASLISNYFLHLWVAHFLGAQWYGTFGILLSLYLINDAVLNVGIPRAVSKFISESGEKFWPIVKASLKVQLLLSLLFVIIYIAFADLFSQLLKDHSLFPYIIFLGIMVLPLSLFSLFLSGYLNGLRLFREQALIKTVFPIARTLLAVILVWAGLAIWGILLAYLISIMIGLAMSYYYIRRFREKKMMPISAKPLLLFALPLMAAVLAMALLRNVNILFIKSLLADNISVALYTAAFTLSNISYLVFTALPLTITPAVSKAAAERNVPLVQKYISSSIRYSLLLLLPVAALVSATSSALLSWLYPSSYAQAGPLLAVLIFASTFLVLFYILLAVITASGSPVIELFFSLFFLALLIFLNFLLIPRSGLLGSAYAQLGTSLLAMLGAAAFVFARYKTLVSIVSLLKMVAAATGIYILATYWQYSGTFLLFNYVGLFLLYILILFLFGELGKEDLDLVKKVLRMKA